MSGDSPPSQPPKLLIVEDERPLADALMAKFQQEGFHVEIAGNGQVGLQQALAERPDMILLDIIMPVMDGLSMLEQLRRDPWGKKANVIILTNLNDWSDMSQAIDHHVHDVLVKSDWRIEDVVSKVKRKLHLD